MYGMCLLVVALSNGRLSPNHQSRIVYCSDAYKAKTIAHEMNIMQLGTLPHTSAYIFEHDLHPIAVLFISRTSRNKTCATRFVYNFGSLVRKELCDFREKLFRQDPHVDFQSLTYKERTVMTYLKPSDFFHDIM